MTRQTTDIGFDPTSMLNDPISELDRIRAIGGIVWSSPMKMWFIVSHDLASEALRDRRLSGTDAGAAFQSMQTKSGFDFSTVIESTKWIPFFLEGNDHKRMRALFARILTSFKTDYLREYEIVSRDLLAGLTERGGGDFAVDYANKVHTLTVGRVAGFEHDECLWLAENLSTDGFADFVQRLEAVIQFSERHAKTMSKLEMLLLQSKAEGFHQKLDVSLTSAGFSLTPRNRLQILFAFLLLGRDTLASTLSVGMCSLLEQNERQMQPSDWPEPASLVDEFIRISTGVQFVFRTVQQHMRLGGQELRSGEKVTIFLNAANRDPTIYTCPHAMKPSQPANLAFGAARHLCSGMPLAKKAIGISLLHLSKLSKVSLDQGATVDAGSHLIRKMKHLPIKITGEF